jgi:hypothetical protein
MIFAVAEFAMKPHRSAATLDSQVAHIAQDTSRQSSDSAVQKNVDVELEKQWLDLQLDKELQDTFPASDALKITRRQTDGRKRQSALPRVGIDEDVHGPQLEWYGSNSIAQAASAWEQIVFPLQTELLLTLPRQQNSAELNCGFVRDCGRAHRLQAIGLRTPREIEFECPIVKPIDPFRRVTIHDFTGRFLSSVRRRLSSRISSKRLVTSPIIAAHPMKSPASP